MDEVRKENTSTGTAALVLGIIAVVTAFIPFVNFLSGIVGLVGLILGIIALVKSSQKGKAIAGTVLSVVGGILAFIMITVYTAAFFGAVAESVNENTTNQVEQSVGEAKLTLDEGWAIDKSNPYATYVNGYVSNNSNEAINGYIQITFSALDVNGANVGDCLANANTVDANGKWKFQAYCTGTGIETVRFKEISGF